LGRSRDRMPLCCSGVQRRQRGLTYSKPILRQRTFSRDRPKSGRRVSEERFRGPPWITVSRPRRPASMGKPSTPLWAGRAKQTEKSPPSSCALRSIHRLALTRAPPASPRSPRECKLILRSISIHSPKSPSNTSCHRVPRDKNAWPAIFIPSFWINSLKHSRRRAVAVGVISSTAVS